MKFDPSHLPILGLITQRAQEFVESLPSIYKAIGILISMGALYTGLTVQNARMEERQEAMNHTLAEIRSSIVSAKMERHTAEQQIVELTRK